eukprot:gene2593-3516_t
MPLYHHVILILPRSPINNLTLLFKKYAATVIETGGTIRSIENHGVRPLPERTKTKFTTPEGLRYYYDARYVSAYIDVSPKGIKDVDRVLKTNENVIRSHLIKAPSCIARINARRFNNPYFVKFKLPKVVDSEEDNIL